MKGRVLIIAGSDSGGGAGIQADIKAVTALGAYAATAVTAITVQDTTGVHAVHEIPPEVVRQQIDVVLSDIGADCIKIGMIGSRAVGEVILDVLRESEIPVVLDPVLVATSGDALGDGAVAGLLRSDLLPRATVVTPNLPELSALAERPAGEAEEIEAAAKALLGLGAKAVLAKGGHGSSRSVRDLLVTEERSKAFEHRRFVTRSTHGTGCTLASAIAAGIAQGMDLEAACAWAIDYVHDAIRTAPGFGKGHGPLNHAVWNGKSA